MPRKEIEAARAELAGLQQRERAIGASLGCARSPGRARRGRRSPAPTSSAGQVVEAKDVLFEIVDPPRVLVEATTADPALAALARRTLAGVHGVTLQLVGAARSLRDGVLPLTFRAQASGRRGDCRLRSASR